jgi:hypothetical protein
MLYIEDAKRYYLVPFKDQNSLIYLGGKKRLLALEMVMDARDVVATTGVNTETCYILVNKDFEGCDRLLKEADEVLKKEKTLEANKGRNKKN